MEIILPSKVTQLSPWSDIFRIRDSRGYAVVMPMRDGARHEPVTDILIQPKKDDRTVFEKLRHVRLHDKHEEGYFRDNPVVHIKCLDDYWTPTLYSGTMRVYDGRMWVGFESFTEVNEFTFPSDQTVAVNWSAQGLAQPYDFAMYGMYFERRNSTSFYWPTTIMLTRWKMGGQWTQKVWRFWNYRADLPKFYPGQGLDEGKVRFVAGHPDSWYDSVSSMTSTTSPMLVYNVSFAADLEKIKAQVHDEMMRSLRYNEKELYANSGKNWIPTNQLPFELQVALGDACDAATQPSEHNPGLPTLGFNNLQNLAALIDGMTLLSLGKDSTIPNALGELVQTKTSKEELYDELAAIGKKSKYRMTHSRQWRQLTPTQQKRLMKYADISSVQNSVNASMIIADANSVKGRWASQSWERFTNAWFQGRYVWATSWSDADQAYRYFWHKMQQALGQEEAHPVLHGRANLSDPADASITPVVRASYSCTERAVTGLAKMTKTLYETGMAPTAAVMWDFIPFSFVVDWFFPISDTLERYSRSEYYSPLYYTYDNGICCSVKYEVQTNLSFKVRCYTRWYQASVPETELGHCILDGGRTPSDKTTAFRTVDGLMLLFRR